VVPQPQRRRSGVIAYKTLVFLLLAANAVWFALGESPSKALDACAWLALLALFVWEADYGDRLSAGRGRLLLRGARVIAAFGVIGAMVGYVFEDNALDTVNSTVWIAVVILLETQLRFPAFAARMRYALTATAVILYGTLAVLVVLWALEGMWIDAYDAVLWLIAFATLELAIARRSASAAGAPAASAG
jgi:hypothetical protein